MTVPETTGRSQHPEEEHGSPEHPGALQMPDEGPFPPRRSHSPSGPREPPARLAKRHAARCDSSPSHGTLLPKETRGCQPHSAISRKLFEASHKSREAPLLRVPALEPRALPTPLAEVQGDFSLQLNQRINRGFVPQTR